MNRGRRLLKALPQFGVLGEPSGRQDDAEAGLHPDRASLLVNGHADGSPLVHDDVRHGGFHPQFATSGEIGGKKSCHECPARGDRSSTDQSPAHTASKNSRSGPQGGPGTPET